MDVGFVGLCHLLPATFKTDVVEWLRDDCPSFDVGGFVVGSKVESAQLLCKTSGYNMNVLRCYLR